MQNRFLFAEISIWTELSGSFKIPYLPDQSDYFIEAARPTGLTDFFSSIYGDMGERNGYLICVLLRVSFEADLVKDVIG